MSTVLRDVGPSLVGGLVLPHGGTIQPKHIRRAGEQVLLNARGSYFDVSSDSTLASFSDLIVVLLNYQSHPAGNLVYFGVYTDRATVVNVDQQRKIETEF